MKTRTSEKAASTRRKRPTPAQDGVATAQRVFAKVLEKADPAKPKRP